MVEIILILCIVGTLYLLWRFLKFANNGDSDVPAVIKKASVWSREMLFKCQHRGVLAKPDVVFLGEGNVLYVGELKTRPRNVVYKTDIIQMSVERNVLISNGRHVSNIGFLKIETGGGVFWREQKLLSEVATDAVIQRYRSILDGAIEPPKCDNKNLCKMCEYRDVC